MIKIPTDLDAWHPNDVAAWLADVAEDPDVTEDEYADAIEAVHEALVDEPAL